MLSIFYMNRQLFPHFGVRPSSSLYPKNPTPGSLNIFDAFPYIPSVQKFWRLVFINSFHSLFTGIISLVLLVIVKNKHGHSTTTALLKVTNDIREGMEDTKLTVLALIDFSNAFNTVCNDIPLAILLYFFFFPFSFKNSEIFLFLSSGTSTVCTYR